MMTTVIAGTTKMTVILKVVDSAVVQVGCQLKFIQVSLMHCRIIGQGQRPFRCMEGSLRL